MAKLHEGGGNGRGGRIWWFQCPGCECAHPFHVPAPWSWNGSLDKPTFRPSLIVWPNRREVRCHSIVTAGIRFQPDCWHKLAGQTVDIPEWDSIAPVRWSIYDA